MLGVFAMTDADQSDSPEVGHVDKVDTIGPDYSGVLNEKERQSFLSESGRLRSYARKRLILNEDERQEMLSEAGKLSAAARRRYVTTCRDCGAEIVGLSRRKFCGQSCQRRHWRARLAEMNPGDELPAVE